MQLRRTLWMFLASLVIASSAYVICRNFFAGSSYLVAATIVASLYMWVPGVFALIYMKQEKMSIKIFHKPTKACMYALLIPFIVVAAGVLLTLPFAKFSSEGLLILAQQYHIHFASPVLNMVIVVVGLYVMALVVSFSINFIFTLGEELFWRGYLWEKVKGFGFWKASAIIGVLWGVWHAPMILLFGTNYPEHRVLGIFFMIAFCLVTTPMMLYLRLQDRSLMAPVLLHGMINAFMPLAVVFFPEGAELLRAPLGIAGIAAWMLLSGWLLFTKPVLPKPHQLS